jgi:hypothetical protein
MTKLNVTNAKFIQLKVSDTSVRSGQITTFVRYVKLKEIIYTLCLKYDCLSKLRHRLSANILK